MICPDYRGRGRSDYDRDWRNYQPRVYLDDLRHILAAAGVHRAVVVGTSLGGILGMALGIVAPTLPAAVVLNDVGPDVATDGLGRIIDYIGKDRPQPDWTTAVRHLRKLFPTLSLKTDQRWLEMAQATFREGDDGLLHFDWDLRLVEPMRRLSGSVPDLWPLYRSLRDLPVMAVRGGLSDVLSEGTFERMAAEKPDLIRVTVAACGHVPALDEPEVLEVLDDFIARF